MSTNLKVGDVIAFLLDPQFKESDDIVISKGKMYIGREFVVLGEIDFERMTVSKGVGLLVESQDSCEEFSGGFQ